MTETEANTEQRAEDLEITAIEASEIELREERAGFCICSYQA